MAGVPAVTPPTPLVHPAMSSPFRLIVGMSGASGQLYGIRLLQILRAVPDVETHLVMSPAARQTIQLETEWDPADVDALADRTYRFGDIAASVSSGSFKINAMIVVPCSMGTLSGIALSSSDNLIERAADVTLKERRRLVIVARETPLHLGHLRLMVQVTELGALIFPPSPAFYTQPKSLDELVDHTVNRLLDTLGIELPTRIAPIWEGPGERRKGSRGAAGDEPA